MNDVYGFLSPQLMELAGLSIATCIHKVYPKKDYENIYILVGPGNNGGDGLICARHLVHFGYKNVHLIYPSGPKKDLFKSYLKQCNVLDIDCVKELPKNDDNVDLYVDGLFGYGFKGEPREPFGGIIKRLIKTKVPIISIDVGSGWVVDSEDVRDPKEFIVPDTLISLGVPKLCAKNYKGRHFLGGRFTPKKLLDKYSVELPEFKGTDQIVEL